MADEVWRNIQNRLRFLVQFRFFPQRTPGDCGAFSAFYRRTISTQWVQNVVKTKKVSACAPSFSEILFENVDYLTRKCATWPRRFLYTESTKHPEHPCAPSGRHARRAAAAWDTHLIFNNRSGGNHMITDMKDAKIFSPLQLGRTTLKNRIAMAPMSMHYEATNGTVPKQLADIFVRRGRRRLRRHRRSHGRS